MPATVAPRLQRHLGINMNGPSNLLLVVSAVEKRLDNFQWTLQPQVPIMGPGPNGQLRSQQKYKVTALAHLGAGA